MKHVFVTACAKIGNGNVLREYSDFFHIYDISPGKVKLILTGDVFIMRENYGISIVTVSFYEYIRHITSYFITICTYGGTYAGNDIFGFTSV